MRNTSLSLVSLTLAVVFTAMFGITACADATAPHNDCQILNGVEFCKPS